jgi:hypothetical protein
MNMPRLAWPPYSGKGFSDSMSWDSKQRNEFWDSLREMDMDEMVDD